MNTSETSAEAEAEKSRLAHFPITFFGVTMGVFGLALAFRTGGFAGASTVVSVLGGIILLSIAAIYILKALRFPA
ncbi:hypothetical protein [Hoeflea prorocentri]|uniref:Uncharacterized protein n=1 Tax=Hoeflea prorocentri TaxID=1922333 RepID=A0A9X3ZJ98_9HYPH|nr:hypothetical protein [Hoeflea prorocentri]MCY6383727.1 hypothetical protein [Hoeflea prorocentri]MDA5401527.1 hypothetical protein [Hoeflea prorocentri]